MVCYYQFMLKLSKKEVNSIIKALVEWQSKLERVKSYPQQKSDIKPYAALTKKLVKYREVTFGKKVTKRAKR